MTIFRCRLLALALTACAGFASSQSNAAIYFDWPIGKEREVDQGVYFTLLKVSSGWRIWKIETQAGVECRAVKSATGKPHPIPIGVGSAFATGTPFLMIHTGTLGLYRYSWHAKYNGKARIQYRKAGEKFWTDGSMSEDDISDLDGRRLEISLTSWQYPEIYVGHSKETAVMDLSGLASALTMIESC